MSQGTALVLSGRIQTNSGHWTATRNRLEFTENSQLWRLCAATAIAATLLEKVLESERDKVRNDDGNRQYQGKNVVAADAIAQGK